MIDLRTAAQQALEVLESLQGRCTDSDDGTVEAITVWCPGVIAALRAALAENALQRLADVQQEIEAAIADQVTHGLGITLGSKRIDPASIYKQAVSATGQESLRDPIGGANEMVTTNMESRPVEPVAWAGYDLDAMVEAFSRVIESHHSSKHPFHNPINMDAQTALRILRRFIPAMKASAL